MSQIRLRAATRRNANANVGRPRSTKPSNSRSPQATRCPLIRIQTVTLRSYRADQKISWRQRKVSDGQRHDVSRADRRDLVHRTARTPTDRVNPCWPGWRVTHVRCTGVPAANTLVPPIRRPHDAAPRSCRDRGWRCVIVPVTHRGRPVSEDVVACARGLRCLRRRSRRR